jgi:hypothetical protein
MKKIEIFSHWFSHNLEKVLNFWQSSVHKWAINRLSKKIRSYNDVDLQNSRSEI